MTLGYWMSLPYGSDIQCSDQKFIIRLIRRINTFFMNVDIEGNRMSITPEEILSHTKRYVAIRDKANQAVLERIKEFQKAANRLDLNQAHFF